MTMSNKIAIIFEQFFQRRAFVFMLLLGLINMIPQSALSLYGKWLIHGITLGDYHIGDIVEDIFRTQQVLTLLMLILPFLTLALMYAFGKDIDLSTDLKRVTVSLLIGSFISVLLIRISQELIGNNLGLIPNFNLFVLYDILYNSVVIFFPAVAGLALRNLKQLRTNQK